MEDRIHADLTLGEHAALDGELAALVVEHPLRERLRGQLMLALYRSGRQADALAGYRDLGRLLATEFGLSPAPALRELERRMLLHDPALAAPSSRHRVSAPHRTARPRRGACPGR